MAANAEADGFAPSRAQGGVEVLPSPLFTRELVFAVDDDVASILE
jgi:hypothetical protein